MASLARFEQAPSERVVKRSANEAAVSMVGENLCPFPANRTRDDAQFLASLIEESERVARRVYGGAHPLVVDIEHGRKCHKLCFTPSPFECSKGACVDNYQFPYWDSA